MATPLMINELVAGVSLSAGAAVAVVQDGVTRRFPASAFITQAESFSQSGIGTVSRTMQDRGRDWVSVKDFGATGDGSTDDTTAVQAALTAAGLLTNATVNFPRGTYKITSKLSISGTRISIVGAGKWACTISNAIVANPADPVFEVTATHDYVLFEGLRIIGNGLTAGSGNGHAIALVGTAGDWASNVYIRDCEIQSLLGNGKDNAGSSMGAAAIYAYGVLNLKVTNCEFTSCQYGIVLDGTSSLQPNKIQVSACTFDTISLQGIRGARAENLVVDQMCVFNACGGGAATDAGIWLQNATLVNILGNRFKNINGNHIAANQSSNYESINIVGNYFNTFYTTAVIDIGTANHCTNLHNNDFLFDTTVTNAVGILISNPSGWIGLGCDIAGNRMSVGGAGTVASFIDINNGTNAMRGLVIRSNVLGQQTAPSGSQVITSGINLRGAGGITAPLVMSNVLNMASPGTLTTGITLASGVAGALVLNNVINGAGTAISDSSSKSTKLIAGDWTFVGSMGFFGTAAQAKQTSGANLTNNVTSGGTDNTIADFTDLMTYANDAAAIRNDIYQLARKLKQVNDALRVYGLLT